jgi:hypothetical protein
MDDYSADSGQCLCGAVIFTVLRRSNHIGACHCSMCRRWGGGPLMAIDCGTDVQFEGENNITVYDSSEWAERGFCKHCGSHLFYRLKASGQHMMPAGLFVPSDNMRFDHQVFIDDKPAFYEFCNETENSTGDEVFAKYAPGD